MNECHVQVKLGRAVLLDVPARPSIVHHSNKQLNPTITGVLGKYFTTTQTTALFMLFNVKKVKPQFSDNAV